jgi:membrane-associated phospholipid phosphatase
MHGARLGRVLLLVASATGCGGTPERNVALGDTPELLSNAVEHLTDVMVGSVTSPPVASRTYAYASIAAYEALRPAHPEFQTLAGQLHGLQPLPATPRDADLLLPVASVAAFLSVAEALVFAPERVASYRRDLIEQLPKHGASRELVTRSVAHGETVAKHILAWAAADGLKQARGLRRFEVVYEPGRWRPTPPAYMDALEPNWHTLRPLVMDSASQFRPPPPLPYDMRDDSGFRRQVMTVYQTGTGLTDEQRAIAAFWDCNPFAVKAEGHVMFADKKISPGGHWMGITGIALRKSGADLMRAAEAYARVAIALREGFISVWDEKYRSVVVRPETIINETIDESWRPVLQTPPFPEYPSGHSVISAASAEVLTALFGEDFAYDDDVEVPYGLPARSFTSFRSAAQEAAVSRLYGGIHYPMAIENGLVQGRSLGAHVIARVETRPAALTTAHR